MFLFILCLVKVLGLLERRLFGQRVMALFFLNKSIKNKALILIFDGLQRQGNSSSDLAGISSISAVLSFFFSFSFSSALVLM